MAPAKPEGPDRAQVPVAPLAHAALVVMSLAPLLIERFPTNANIVLTAILTVYIGCRRSVKPTPPPESMTQKDALRFPFIGSAILVSLFVLFKVLPKDLVNLVLTAYFVLLGTVAITATVLPFVAQLFSKAAQEKEFRFGKIKVPYFMDEAAEISATVPECVCGLVSLAFCCWYYAKKHWLANNALGLAFAIQGIEHLSLGSVSTGVILLAGLFVYDIFWVFCTPVMVTVARSFDAPIKLLFPRVADAATSKVPFAMLGLGDIVIPGIFVAIILRYDVAAAGKQRYFPTAYLGYTGGLVLTILVMNVFQAAQPALLYIVPAILGAVGAHAAIQGEFSKVWKFSEAPEDHPEGESSDSQKPVSAGVLTRSKASETKKIE